MFADLGDEILTHAADVFSELLERGAQSFGIGVDFWRIHHKHHTVNLVFEARFLYEAHVRSDWLFCTELRRIKRL